MAKKELCCDSYIQYQAFAAHLGTTIIEGAVPECLCLVCKSGAMKIFRDSEYDRDWWFCNRCGHADTTLGLYRHIARIRDIESAATALRGVLKIDVPEPLWKAAIRSSTEKTEIDRAVASYWTRSRERLRKYKPTKSAAGLQQLNGWGYLLGYDLSGIDVGTFVGSNSFGLIETVLPYLDRRSGLKQGMQDALVIGYEQLPGLVSSLQFIGRSRSHRARIRTSDGGLAGLQSACRLRGTECFGVDDIGLFLRLQNEHVSDTSTPMPVVAYSDGSGGDATGLAWRCLPQSDIYLWPSKPSILTVNQARISPGTGARIATKPAPEDSSAQTKNPYQLMDLWRKSSVSWVKFLCDLLCLGDIATGLENIDRLDYPLTDTEIEAMEAACSARDWRRIKSLLLRAPVGAAFNFSGEKIVEREGYGWLRIDATPQSPEVLISEAVIIIHSAGLVGDDIIFTGEIRLGQHAMPFCAKESDIRKDPASWLTKACVTADAGVPNINNHYRGDLLDIALARKPVTVVKSISKSGWDNKEQAFVFPNVVIRSSGVTTHPAAGVVNGVIPGTGLVVGARAVANPESAAADAGWAIAGSIASNLIRKSKGMDTKGIVVVDALGAGQDGCNKISEVLGLISAVRSGDATEADLAALAEQERRHDLPVLLRANTVYGPNWESWARYAKPHNMICNASIEGAVNLALVGQWWGVVARDETGACDSLNAVGPAMTSYLTTVLKSGEIPTPEQSTTGLMQIVYGRSHDTSGTSRRCIALGEQEAWRRFLDCVFAAIYRRRLCVGNSMAASDKNLGIVRDVERLTVFVRWEKLERELRKMGWFVPPADVLDAAFESLQVADQTSDGWALRESWWNQQYEDWVSVFR
jgi:hypothetical protein